MREIKFRVWDLLDSRMLGWGGIFMLPAWEIFAGTPEQRAFEVMQYTGLRDKNSVEIYEGDIVRLRNAAGFHCSAKVEFVDGCFEVVFQMSLYDPQLGVSRNRDYLKVYVANHACEVIGNIYANPELLAK